MTALVAAGLPLALVQTGRTLVEPALPQWVEVATSIATVVIALALTVVALAMVPTALALKSLIGRLHSLMDRAQGGIDPVLKSAGTAAENVAYISASVRDDVEGLKGTVLSSQQRLNHAAALAEQRINEFSALLEVVQEEAEHIFIGTASTLRGMRAGAERLQRFRDEPEVDAARPTGRVPPRT